MRKIGIVILGLFIFTACGNVKKESKESQKETVGNNKDEHGCIASAGYIWSELKQDCIRVFEIGQGLSPVTIDNNSETSSAFVVFNDDQSKLELFLPGTSKSIILPQVEKGKYSADDYLFDTENATLSIKGEPMYKANNKEK